MTELLRRIEDIVAPTIVGMGYELVRVSMSRGGGILQIMIEPADGRPMDVEACAIISARLVGGARCRGSDSGAYTLEVSSPGIDRPLTREKDYTRWTGHVARMETALPIEGRRRFKGTLLGLEGGVVKLQARGRPGNATCRCRPYQGQARIDRRVIDEHRRAQEGVEQAH